MINRKITEALQRKSDPETVAIFLDRLDILTANVEPVLRADLDAQTMRLRDAARLLRELIEANAADLAFDPQAVAALPVTIEYLERHAANAEHLAARNLVERQSRERGPSDATRVLGRRVAGLIEEVFGKPIPSIAAQIATEISGEEVTLKHIQNWVVKNT